MTDENKSFFFDEWRDCLHSHYLYVVETSDAITEPTLRSVLMDAGITEQTIEDWHTEALERMGANFPVAEPALDDAFVDIPEALVEPADEIEPVIAQEPAPEPSVDAGVTQNETVEEDHNYNDAPPEPPPVMHTPTLFDL